MFLLHGVAAKVVHPYSVALRLDMVAVRLSVAFDQVAVFIRQYFPQVEEIAVLFQCNGGKFVVDVAQAVAVQLRGLPVCSPPAAPA